MTMLPLSQISNFHLAPLETKLLPPLDSFPKPAAPAGVTSKIEGLLIERAISHRQGSALFSQELLLTLQIGDAHLKIAIEPGHRTIIGRWDEHNAEAIHIDLMPFGGRQQGVSRVHAAIFRTSHTLALADLGSANGTFVNGQRLTPHQPCPIYDCDHIRLGKLPIQIHY